MSTVPVFPLHNRGQLHARAIRGRDTMPGREGAARVCPPPPPEKCYQMFTAFVFFVDSEAVDCS